MNNYIKQIIVLRTKYPDGNGGFKNIRTGKLVAQACHASIAFLGERIMNGEKLTKLEYEWLTGLSTKVCVQVNSEQELLDIYNKAKESNITAHLITDAGLTEFHGIETMTCVAIGPDTTEKIDSITGHLKLY